MSLTSKTYQKLGVLLLIILNALPYLAMERGHITLDDMIYLYWGECVLLGSLALFIHAKRLIVFLILLLAAAPLIQLSGFSIDENPKISLTFWSLYCLFWLCYIEIGKSTYWQKIRRQHPLEQFIYYLFFLVIGIAITFSITAAIYDKWHLLSNMAPDFYIVFFGLTFIIPTLSIGFLKIIDMIGSRHFLHLLFGTYHRPVEKERVVLFLDMVGSSAMAEKMDPKESLDVIASFIFDASAIFRRNGGDILNYTGDGLVVIWPTKMAHRAFKSAIELKRNLEIHRATYKKKFDFIPDFRIGIHAGTIVIGQIGEEKLFLGLYGDVVNTASRLEQMNKTFKTKILLSGAVARLLPPSNMPLLKPLGIKDVRGKEEKIELFTLQTES